MHQLPSLPYAHNALEPHIDAATMEIHHGKHHNAYVANLNKALEGHDDLQSKSVEELLADLDALPEAIRGAVRNNGGGHANHSLFWPTLGPNGGGAPSGDLAAAIDNAFGSFDAMKDAVNKAAMTRFGSGWGWLVKGDSGLEVMSTANQDSPLSVGKTPLLGIDVWEHGLLPALPEPPRRLPERGVERDRVGRGGRALRGLIPYPHRFLNGRSKEGRPLWFGKGSAPLLRPWSQRPLEIKAYCYPIKCVYREVCNSLPGFMST